MKRIAIATILAICAANPSFAEDSRIVRLCGTGHTNEVAAQDDVRANPGGYYVASLSEQLSTGDPRIILSTADGPYLCTRSAATPLMDAIKAILLMNERTVKYLFVPAMPVQIDETS